MFAEKQIVENAMYECKDDYYTNTYFHSDSYYKTFTHCYIGQIERIKDQLTSVFMHCNRAIYGQPVPLKTKNEYICQKIGVKTPRQLMLQASLKFMHKIVNNQTPH